MGFSQQPGALNLPTSEGLQKNDYIKPYNNLLLTHLPLHVLVVLLVFLDIFHLSPLIHAAAWALWSAMNCKFNNAFACICSALPFFSRIALTRVTIDICEF